jgi:hypothetical protein
MRELGNEMGELGEKKFAIGNLHGVLLIIQKPTI